MAERQLIVFKLDQEEYGVDIMNVQEIGSYEKPTKVPNAPDFVEGIINLRGTIIPIVSLRKRFRLPEGKITELTRLVVINIGSKQIGFVVDDASEVLTMYDENIEAPPAIIVGQDKKYIAGVGKAGNRILIILDLNKLFTEEEHEELQGI